MAKTGRDAVSLPPLPMSFQEAVGDYLKVKHTSARKPKPPQRRTRKSKKAK